MGCIENGETKVQLSNGRLFAKRIKASKNRRHTLAERVSTPPPPACKERGINIDKSSGLSRPFGASALEIRRGVKRENKIRSICYIFQRNLTDKHNNPVDCIYNIIFPNNIMSLFPIYSLSLSLFLFYK